MKTQLHDFNEQIADCIIALTFWRQATKAAVLYPSPESRHFERTCYAELDKFPDAVRTEAEICISRRAA